MVIYAPAKINLALDVISRRPDGYHQVDMVMQSIELADRVTLEPAAAIGLSCNSPGIPTDESNLAWRAARLLQDINGITKGVKITINKKIPLAAGLAGGSADAAAVLIGLNQLWGLGYSQLDLMKLGLRLGADVPFCIMKGTARAKGIGEQLTPIDSELKSKVLLVTPNIQLSTPAVYQKLQIAQVRYHPQIVAVIAALETGDFNELYANWGNVLEEAVLKENLIVAEVKLYFKRFGLKHCLMSGSGPTVFALDPPEDIIEPFLKGLPSGWFGCLTGFQNN